MIYTVKFQSPASYSGDWYKYNTIGKSGCGPASVCNALKNAGIADVSVPTMCALAVSCGARVDGGTVMATLLNACKSKYGITYKTTSKNADLTAHLKAGGTAVCWCGGGYPLFSDSGHFVAAVGLDNSGLIYVADSLYYSGKWSYNSTRKSQIKTTGTTGLVRCSITALGKATADRAPSYFLISKASTTSKTTATNTTTTTKQEDDEMVESTPHVINGVKKNFNAITKEGITYVSLRELCTTLGLKLRYDSNTKERIVELNDVEITMDSGAINVPGAFVNSDTHLAAVGPMLREMGYDVGCTEAYKITATLPETEITKETIEKHLNN